MTITTAKRGQRGPKTPAGRLAVRLNASTHGMRSGAASRSMPGADHYITALSMEIGRASFRRRW